MTQERIHRAVSEDGTQIAGRVQGHGPPVVLVHGAMADGDSEWGPLLPLLTDRFTCYLPSTRGRGLSEHHPDPSREARVKDVTAFVESIGEPVSLVGVSGGGMLALGVAARTPAVAATAVCEPVVFEVLGDETRSRLQELIELTATAVEEGDPGRAAEAFLGLIANDEEVAALSEDPDALEEVAAYVPVDLEEFRECMDPDGPSPTDPTLLEQTSAPVLLLHGSETALPWFTESTRYAAQHIPNSTVREVAGNGHLGHLVHPNRVADQLVPFLEAARTVA